ncbi:caspase family protein, partial [Butyricimonas paravirosa]|uniref:caspase family protein n=1 Tax=Butyricimonas paravirosa TaxID=1472417 RepID=UPI0022E0B263
LAAYNGTAKAIVYYAGHGIPDEKQQSAYLLPADGYGSDPSTAYALQDFYAMLNNAQARNITVFLDACFSGAKRENGMLASARGVAIKVRQEIPRGKMVIFTAAQGDETAYQYAEKGHGMFTYFLLKKLQESQGNTTLGELSDY